MDEAGRWTWKDVRDVAVTIFLGIAILNLTACGSLSKTPTYSAVRLHGPCFMWGGIEKKRKGKEMCWIPWPEAPGLTCNREDGHSGRHHVHRGQDCVAVWK